MRTTTQQTESWFYTSLCNAAPPPPPPPPLPPSTYPNRISRSLWRSHASCVSPVALWNKFHILWHRYCYMLQSLVLIGGKKQKHLMFVCTIMLSWHWIKRIKEENSRNKAELKDRIARCIKPVWLKIMAFSEKHESEMKEEERVEGLSSFCYIIEQNTERVESVSAWCPCCFPTRAGTESSEWNKCTWRKKKGLMFGSSIQSIRSTLAFLFRWSLTPRGSVHHWSQRKKKKSSQSYCQFASLLLRLLGSSDLRLQRFNYYFFFVSVHKTRPLNTEQSLPIAIVDNTVYNNESDGDN